MFLQVGDALRQRPGQFANGVKVVGDRGDVGMGDDGGRLLLDVGEDCLQPLDGAIANDLGFVFSSSVLMLEPVVGGS